MTRLFLDRCSTHISSPHIGNPSMTDLSIDATVGEPVSFIMFFLQEQKWLKVICIIRDHPAQVADHKSGNLEHTACRQLSRLEECLFQVSQLL